MSQDNASKEVGSTMLSHNSQVADSDGALRCKSSSGLRSAKKEIDWEPDQLLKLPGKSHHQGCAEENAKRTDGT